jgi:hypothetical protein
MTSVNHRLAGRQTKGPWSIRSSCVRTPEGKTSRMDIDHEADLHERVARLEAASSAPTLRQGLVDLRQLVPVAGSPRLGACTDRSWAGCWPASTPGIQGQLAHAWIAVHDLRLLFRCPTAALLPRR